MKLFLSILWIVILWVASVAGPPEPPEPPPTPEIPKVVVGKHEIAVPKIDTSKIREMTRNLEGMDDKLARLEDLMRDFSDSVKIKDLSIGGDSILIVLSNDSTIFLKGNTASDIKHDDNSFVNVGNKYTVEEGKVVTGNIVNVGADVIVKGVVNGSVMTLGGDIYVTSTGFIRDGAVAVSGKLKVEPGGRVTNVRMAFNESRYNSSHSDSHVFQVMAAIFLMIYVIWLVLAATFTSLLKSNVERVVKVIIARPWKSFFFGYLAYLLALAAIIVLILTILGIPVALVGVPVALFASMVLAVTALSNLIGVKVTGSQEISLRTFLIGTLILAGLPGLFFFIQLVTGSLVMMIFSWIMIGFLVCFIVPLGLGAVLSTRFGTRDLPPGPAAPVPPAETAGPQLAPQAPPA